MRRAIKYENSRCIVYICSGKHQPNRQINCKVVKDIVKYLQEILRFNYSKVRFLKCI